MKQILVQCPVWTWEQHVALGLGLCPCHACLLQHTALSSSVPSKAIIHPKVHPRGYMTLIFPCVHGLLTITSCCGKRKATRRPASLLGHCPIPPCCLSPSLPLPLYKPTFHKDAGPSLLLHLMLLPRLLFPVEHWFLLSLKCGSESCLSGGWQLTGTAAGGSWAWLFTLLCLPISLSKTDGRCKTQQDNGRWD